MRKEEKQFWENLEVPVNDIFELKYSGKPKTRLRNRLEKSPGWLKVINVELDATYSDLKELVNHLYRYKTGEFLRIYFLTEFKEKVDRNSIRNRTPHEIQTRYEQDLNTNTVSYDALLYSILKFDDTILEKIYYDFFINKASLNTYRCNPTIDIQNFLDNLTHNQIDEFLNKLHEEKKIKTKFKQWWFERDTGKIKILIRVENSKSQAIHQVDENIFIKTAGPRLLIISEGGNRLDTLVRYSESIAKWANMLVSEAAQKDVTFSLVTQEFTTENVTKFLEKIRGGQVKGISLKAVSRSNAPVTNSPTIKIESRGNESVEESLKDLESKHGLDLMKTMEDITSITILVNEKTYKIMTTTKDGKTKFNFDSKYLTEEEKDELVEVLTNEIPG